MATIEQLQEAMAAGLQSKCINTLLKDFSRMTREDAEDLTQVALAECAATIGKVNDIAAIVVNKAKLRAIDQRTIELRRRSMLPIHRVYVPRRRDPFRPIDFKIDLERAIKRTLKGTLERNAAWLIFYVGYTIPEIAGQLPTTRTTSGWINRLHRDVVAPVRKRMRRGGYRA